MRLSCNVCVCLRYKPYRGFSQETVFIDWFIRDFYYPTGIAWKAIDSRGPQYGGLGRDAMLHRWLRMPPPDRLPF